MRALLLAGILGLASGLAPSASADAPVGRWYSEYGQGLITYAVENGSHDRLAINCDEGGSFENKVNVDVAFHNVAARPGSEVSVVIDGDPIDFVVGASGHIPTDCHACAENFDYLWDHLRRARTIVIRDDRGRRASLPIMGIRKSLPAKKCVANFYRPNGAN